ncbi:thermonuclease family protein [Nostoc sp. CENA67]|uniref:Thermonuclease family protein n=1 Tax=Amazonocrinis nigriterrae CENA67 TaxID=2794033 RepID=A0A8J7HVT4_9NOST|nr:thermonuclease family protein [Amazonocrinis nigriterrae]MBH8564468.1 thermonuclease family protein [Amazonocrinis nigriterrae CENA67]
MEIKLIHKTKIYIAILLGVTTGISGCEKLSANNSINSTGQSKVSGQTTAPPIDWTVTKPPYDGDTINVSRNGEKLKVRFACVDSPELRQPMGKESRDYLRSLILSSKGKVGLDIISSDRYGRKVAEVWIDTPERGIELVQGVMVVTGHTYPYELYKKDCRHWEAVTDAQKYAQSQRLGVWGGNYQKPWDYRREQRQNR